MPSSGRYWSTSRREKPPASLLACIGIEVRFPAQFKDCAVEPHAENADPSSWDEARPNRRTVSLKLSTGNSAAIVDDPNAGGIQSQRYLEVGKRVRRSRVSFSLASANNRLRAASIELSIRSKRHAFTVASFVRLDTTTCFVGWVFDKKRFARTYHWRIPLDRLS